MVSARIDTRLNLHIFNRLLVLPVDYFERNQTGATTHRLMQVFRVREFLTGRLMGTFLDSFTLFILLPFLFWLEPTLAWITLAIGVLISFIILVFLPVMRRLIAPHHARRGQEGQRAGRDRDRHPHREKPRPRGRPQGGVGRARGGGQRMAAEGRAAEQLAADAGAAARDAS